MNLATIEFASGHKCIDNGLNDYDLICPRLGAKVCFLPYMIARTLQPDDQCPHCAQRMGEKTTETITHIHGSEMCD